MDKPVDESVDKPADETITKDLQSTDNIILNISSTPTEVPVEVVKETFHEQSNIINNIVDNIIDKAIHSCKTEEEQKLREKDLKNVIDFKINDFKLPYKVTIENIKYFVKEQSTNSSFEFLYT